MLLPSAIPCDIGIATRQPSRPKLLSYSAYSPQPQESYAGSILASCRALQAILGGSSLPPAQSHTTEWSIASNPDHTSPFASRVSQSPPHIITPPRGFLKRSRDEFEEDEIEKENLPRRREDRDCYQTPKRCRRIPLDIPPGLHTQDFASLGSPVPTTPRRERDEKIEMPPYSVEVEMDNTEEACMQLDKRSPIQTRSRRRSKTSLSFQHQPPDPSDEMSSIVTSELSEQWSPLDDRRLVEVVLSKLSLSKRDWNDCAKQLGKDKDSLGKRWKLLVGEGNVGLRRGTGRHERQDLDITSW